MGLISFAGKILGTVIDTTVDAATEVIEVAGNLPAKVFGGATKMKNKIDRASDKAAAAFDEATDD